MAATNQPWASDVQPSMPAPLTADNPGLVPMFGFTFTALGLRHDLTQAQHDELKMPMFGPSNDPTNTIRGDAGLDD